MAPIYLKKRCEEVVEGKTQADVTSIVKELLDDVEKGGEEAVKSLSLRLDKWDGAIIVTKEEIDAAFFLISDEIKADIAFAHSNVKRFAEAQLATIKDIEIEVIPGLIAGQKTIPINSAGCYVPGGRYCHIASAIMTITTAKVAGVKHITACHVPKVNGIDPIMLYTMQLCGADVILALGGVQAIASMAYGLFDVPKADIIVGPGNQFVAEAKRLLFGTIGIDMIAGPTESMVIADETADPHIVAADLIGQAEHGWNTPVWLLTSDKELARQVVIIAPELISTLPEPNRTEAQAAWDSFAEIVICDTREEMASLSDEYASEHLQVMCNDLDWWLQNLKCYGSLFLGEETTVAYGDKCSGPNHVLPTSSAARYTGGLSVQKFLKNVTYQRATRAASVIIGETTARISRLEGMEGHARSADVRLQKYKNAHD